MKKYSETFNAIADMRDLSEQELKKASGGCGPSICGGPHGPIPVKIVGVIPAPAPAPAPIPAPAGGCFHGGCHGGFDGFEEERFFRFHHRRHCGC